MELVLEVIAQRKIPTDMAQRFQYNADRLVATVMTQTFHYMINLGLEYSYLTTGESYVFLWIEEGNRETLHYHPAVPKEEAETMRI
jgi:hypothetical protein